MWLLNTYTNRPIWRAKTGEWHGPWLYPGPENLGSITVAKMAVHADTPILIWVSGVREKNSEFNRIWDEPFLKHSNIGSNPLHSTEGSSTSTRSTATCACTCMHPSRASVLEHPCRWGISLVIARHPQEWSVDDLHLSFASSRWYVIRHHRYVKLMEIKMPAVHTIVCWVAIASTGKIRHARENFC